MRLGLTVLRLVIGGLHVAHGAQKVFGLFGGGGPEGTGKFFESAGLRPGKPLAHAAGLSEMVGGALLALGLATPLGATMLSGVQLTAIRAVHFERGLWITEGGFEYNLSVLAALFALTEGPGALSIDAARGGERTGLGWAIAQLAGGAAGAAAVSMLSKGDVQGAGPVEAATGGA